MSEFCNCKPPTRSRGAAAGTIGNLTIDFSNAKSESLTGGVPGNGQLVKVKGPTHVTAETGMATQVVPAGAFEKDLPNLQMEGYITEFTSAASFKIDDIAILDPLTKPRLGKFYPFT